MRLTASKAVSQLAVKPKVEQLERVHNAEVRPLLEQLRAGVNARGIERPTPVVSDGAGTYVTIWTSDVLLQDCSWTIEADIAGAGATARAAYRLLQTVTSVAGTVAALGATTVVHSAETAAACDARFAVDAVNRVVTIEARDDAAETMNWTAVAQTHEGVTAQ